MKSLFLKLNNIDLDALMILWITGPMAESNNQSQGQITNNQYKDHNNQVK